MIISTNRDPFPDTRCFSYSQQSAHWTCVFCKISWYHSYWQTLLESVCWSHLQKGRKSIGFIHRAFHSAHINTRRTLYLALDRPILEYASTTWHPLNIKLTKRFACRVILQQWKYHVMSFSRNLTYQPLLSVVMLSPFVTCSKSSMACAHLPTLTDPIPVPVYVT